MGGEIKYSCQTVKMLALFEKYDVVKFFETNKTVDHPNIYGVSKIPHLNCTYLYFMIFRLSIGLVRVPDELLQHIHVYQDLVLSQRSLYVFGC